MYIQLHRMAEWIVDGGPKGLWPRIAAVVGGQYLCFLVDDWNDGHLTNSWWLKATATSLFTASAFCLWRFAEYRRRVARKRAKSVVPLALG
ncbi:hypothetical protein [Caulobacter sp. RL271]|jgi:hypothetical protein|uniref:Uncharacterized protein n=1 Tax=Caulobacter segnis TaxID=88688 RepID=A0ABY4ZXR3_9CAUL|nr:hypothetical protein [Caulobacter segnis]USQ97530.1 hypothetical protein MZV50_08330 [Caulobacter segnis]